MLFRSPAPPPVKGSLLTFLLSNGNIVLGWPATDPSQLQFVTNLPASTNLPTTAWQSITNAPATLNGTNYFTNALSAAPKKFYRLAPKN